MPESDDADFGVRRLDRPDNLAHAHLRGTRAHFASGMAAAHAGDPRVNPDSNYPDLHVGYQLVSALVDRLVLARLRVDLQRAERQMLDRVVAAEREPHVRGLRGCDRLGQRLEDRAVRLGTTRGPR